MLKLRWRWIAVLATAWAMISCAGAGGGGGGGTGSGGGGGTMGDMAGGDDPAEGGISEVPNPSAAMASASGTSIGQLQRGHEVYMLKCGECHTYMLPQDLDVDEWEDAMPKMIRHAGLPGADEKAVLDYVVAVKKQQGE
jgi:hypothetical protein